MKSRKEIRDFIKHGRITTKEKIYESKKYQILDFGGKYLSIGVCVDNSVANKEKK